MKRAQSALEYLTTYGWAIMGILAIIGVMTYMGFSDSTNNLPSSCILGSSFACGSYFALETGDFAFEFTNMERTAINITDLTCEFSDGSLQVYNSIDYHMAIGDSAVLACEPLSPLALPKKDLFKVKIQYEYDEMDPLPRLSTGELIIGVSDDTDLMQDYKDASINLN